MTRVLCCDSVQSGYGKTPVIHGFNISINAHDVYALIGKNGAGKSTLLKTIVGLLPTSAGRIEILGQDTTSQSSHRIISSGVSYAPQEHAFFSDLSVSENLRLGSLRLTEAKYTNQLKQIAGIFPFIEKRLRQRAGTLSGGEQAMVKVARALLPQPDIVLLDEVSEGLQPLAIDRVVEALSAERAKRQITILAVEQNVDFVMRIANRYGLIDRGQLLDEGHMEDYDAAAKIEKHLSI
jgi:branched-chain amino acid transport system ATP-binding protein